MNHTSGLGVQAIGTNGRKMCGICGEVASPQASHIVPKCEFKRLKGDDQTFLEMWVQTAHSLRSKQDGYKQQYLLCDECEKMTAMLDCWGSQVSDKARECLPSTFATSCWGVSGVDPAVLLQFLCSVLLRCHAAEGESYRDFTLGTAFNRVVAAFYGEAPAAHGVRYYVTAPVFKGALLPFGYLPRMSQCGGGALVWLGGYHFTVGLDTSNWSPLQRWLSTHTAERGIIVMPEDLTAMPVFQEALRDCEAIEASRMTRRPEQRSL